MKRLFSTLCLVLTLATTMQAQIYLGISTDKTRYSIPISDVDSLVYSSGTMDMLPELMKADPAISLFTEALYLTGINERLYWFIDTDYHIGADSVNWDNQALVKKIAPEYDNVAYPKQRRRAFTVFAEPDTVFANKYGITDIKGLKQLAARLYDPVYPADAGVTDPTDARNSLHRFVLYHILNRRATYFMLTCQDGHQLAGNFNRRLMDISDWYETLLPQASLKCSFPYSRDAGLYINRRGIQSHEDNQGVFVRGAKLTPPDNMKEWGVENESEFGVYHYIDDIISYDLETQKNLGGELWRVDATTLSPDFMTQTGYNDSPARGHQAPSSGYYGNYTTASYNSDITNPRYCLGFKAGTAENYEFKDDETHLHVRPRTLQFWSYQGDEVALSGPFDVTVKLPPLPAGKYELLLGVAVEIANRATVQVYLDGVPMGVPIDPSVSAASLGWNSDDETELNASGWRKGPKEYSTADGYDGTRSTAFSDIKQTLRRILGYITYDGKTDHYLRLKNLYDADDKGFPFDYLDFIPVSLLNE